MTCAALHDVLVQMLAAQIEEAIAEPDVLGIILLAEYRHRQFGGPSQHLDLADVDFDRAGRQFGIFGAVRPPPHLAVDAHHPFRAQRLGHLESRAVGIGDHLGQAVMVAQIDEQHAAMVADAMAPAGKPHLVADVACAKRAAVMAAIAVHCRLHSLLIVAAGTRKAHASPPLSSASKFRVAGRAFRRRMPAERHDKSRRMAKARSRKRDQPPRAR